jgi:hypothetical protein
LLMYCSLMLSIPLSVALWSVLSFLFHHKCVFVLPQSTLYYQCGIRLVLWYSLFQSGQSTYIIGNRRGHECSRIWKLSADFTLIQCIKIVSIFLGRDMSETTFFRVETSLVQSNFRSLQDLKS